MEFKKFFVFLLTSVVLTGPVLAQDDALLAAGGSRSINDIDKPIFFKINNDLKRVGIDEIRKMSVKTNQDAYIAQTEDYALNEGDVISINFWGKLEGSSSLVVDEKGNIVIPHVGKINILNLTLNEAKSLIEKELNKKFSNVEFDIDLKKTRNMKIVVLGNVFNPGSYEANPSSRIDEILAKSGGPNYNGNLSDIKLMRDGKEIASFNVYNFIFKGDQSKNLRLRNGDTVYVPLCKNLVAIRGYIRYPGIYDIDSDMPLSKVLDMACNTVNSNVPMSIYILRIDEKTKETSIYKNVRLDSSKPIDPKDDVLIKNFDSIVVAPENGSIGYPVNIFKFVTIMGEVNTPGDYLMEKGDSLSSLIKKAGGLKSTAFTKGTIFNRKIIRDEEKMLLDETLNIQNKTILDIESRLSGIMLTAEERIKRDIMLQSLRKRISMMASYEPEGRIIVNLEDVLNGRKNIMLNDKDVIYIPRIPEWVIISGAVYKQGAVMYSEKKPVEYYLNLVGGPNKSADKDDVYVIKPDGRVESKGTGISEITQGDMIVVPEKIL